MAFCASVTASASWALEPTESGYGGASSVGPVVRNIRFERNPIFSQEDREKLRWVPLGLVDALHVDTRISVIRRELGFAEGDRVGPDVIEESERRLRASRFFGEANIQLTPVAADSVDVLVRTREVWTTSLNVQYERFEDQLLWTVQLREKNFLGAAKGFSFTRAEDEDRSTWSVGVNDRQLFDGRWRGWAEVGRSDDGTTTTWSVGRPFFQLDSMWGLGSEYLNRGARLRFYLNELEYVRPQVQLTSSQMFLGRKLMAMPDAVWRVGLAYGLTDQNIRPEDGLVVRDARGRTGATADLAPPREERRLRIPKVWVQRSSRRYARQRFLYAMGRIEDIPLGFEHFVELGWALRVGDATDSGLWLTSRHSWMNVSANTVYSLGLDSRGLFRSGGAENFSLAVRGSLNRQLARQWWAAAGVRGATSSLLDRSSPFFLGLATGLRAARFREFAGDRLVRSNLELRWVYVDGLLDLVTPGLTAFFDAGTTWYEEESNLAIDRVRGAVGVGLRLGLNRGSEEIPIRVDVGWPLFARGGTAGAVLSIGTGQVF